MKIYPPMFISSRLMAAVKIGEGTEQEATIHIEPIGGYRWRIIIEGQDFTYTDDKLSTPPQGEPDPNDTMAALLTFLSAAAEAYRHSTQHPEHGEPENLDLFSPEVNEWAYMVEDEITIAQLEIEDGVIERSR